MKHRGARQADSYQVPGRGKPAVHKPGHRKTLAAAVILAVGLVGVAIHSVSAPVAGHTIKPEPADFKVKAAAAAQAPVLPSGAITSTYFRLALPPGYSVQPASQTVPGLLYAQAMIKPSNSGSLIIDIAVKPLTGRGLSDDSSYALRTSLPGRYQIVGKVIGGDTVEVANDTQSADVVAFWPHGQYEATIGISSGITTPGSSDNTDELAAMQPLLAAWQWR